MTVTKADVLAMIDVVNQLTNEIDDLGTEDAIALHEEMTKLHKAAKLAADLLETRSVNLLDGQPAKVGDRFYAPSSEGTGKWRPEHGKIRALIVDRAIDAALNKETGEINARTAVRTALDLVYSGFISESKMPNQRLLAALDVDNKAVATYERGRKKLKILGEEHRVDDED